MPYDNNIKRILVIGSGPIIIGQAAEFDYSGTQACRALKEDGIDIILINSNPATIMTDRAIADKIYIEPLTVTTLKRLIIKEKPDSILGTFGGQTGLTLSMQLARDGFLKEQGVRLLGTSLETIEKAEDRQQFKETMESIGQPVIPSKTVTDIGGAFVFAQEIGYPVVIRPAFTLGGSGGGIANDDKELREIASVGLKLSPITQVLVEKSVAGWKEVEFEVMRDGLGNSMVVCSMENLDPVGIHTGDSIVIAPTVTLSDREYQMLRSASLTIIEALGIEGGCNCQFALDPRTFDYAVIEVNPRVSRSSALASKATGYPIAKVAAKIAIGYHLDEIINAITGKTFSCTEPALDYVAVKFPKWPFDKFVYAKRTLGTQMKATGEVMAIADTFEMALMKAVRGVEISLDSLNLPALKSMSQDGIISALHQTTDERLFAIFEAMKRGIPCSRIHAITKIDMWFLHKIKNLADYELELAKKGLTGATYMKGKKLGYPDVVLERISGGKIKDKIKAVYKMVDTCGGEFRAETPYFYAAYAEENEAAEYIQEKSRKDTVVVIGSGPIRIGQGIEFDYSSVHCAWTLKKLGYEVVFINNNPETVSTDFDTADRLYFEPLYPEDVLNILQLEQPVGVVVAYGGQTAIKLTKFLEKNRMKILGTQPDQIDLTEDRKRFDNLLESIHLKRPMGFTVMEEQEALTAANSLAYPVLVRPSYVLGGQNMIIAHSDEDIKEYLGLILREKIENPILIDKYIRGIEIEADAICDGEDVLIPGIMEHVERTGIHSGDSIAVYPPRHLEDEMTERVVSYTKQLALALGTIGLMNVQYIISGKNIYIIEVNARASRTIPYISKVTGVPMVELATEVMTGGKLNRMGYGTGLYRASTYVAVKVPVFSFEKLIDVDTQLGPEMKSTGEVLGIGRTYEEAIYKGFIAAGYKLEKEGGVLITVRNEDKDEVVEVAARFAGLGFSLYATDGTAKVLQKAGLNVISVRKIHESEDNTMVLIESGKISYIISTSTKGRNPQRDSVKIRMKASILGIPCLTSIDTAYAMVCSLNSGFSQINTELIDINVIQPDKSGISR